MPAASCQGTLTTVPKLVLASASPRRRELLTYLGVPFKVLPIPMDESRYSNEAPSVYVRRLALQKAKAVQSVEPQTVIIAADTIVALGGQIFGKPTSKTEAFSMLTTLSAKTHTVHTGVAIVYLDRAIVIETVTSVTFMALDEPSIHAYLACHEWQDKAGAYALQGKAIRFIEKIDGSPSGVIGLPLPETTLLLKEFGCIT